MLVFDFGANFALAVGDINSDMPDEHQEITRDDITAQIPEDKRARSLRASVWDGAFFSAMLGFGEVYFIPMLYAIKASNYFVGLFSAIPQLCVAFFQFLAIFIVERYRYRKRVILMGASTQALMLGIIVIGLLATKHDPWFFVIVASVYYSVNGLAVPAWNSLLGDLTRSEDRGKYFGYRNGLCAFVVFIALLFGGWIIQRFDNLGSSIVGFAAIMFIAMICRFISVAFLGLHYDVPYTQVKDSYFSFWAFIKRSPKSNFAHFTYFVAFMNLSVMIAGPFFAIYMLRDVGMTYMQYTIAQGVSVVAQFIAMRRWGPFADRYGNRMVLRLTSIIMPILPIMWLFGKNYFYILFLMVLSGLSWAGWALSSGNFIFDAVSPQKRARCSAYLNVFACTGVFFGALIGGYITTHVPQTIDLGITKITFFSVLQSSFLVSGIVRMLVVLIFMPSIREVREVPHPKATDMFMMLTNIKPVYGGFFEPFTGSGRKLIAGILKSKKNDSKNH